MTIRWRDEDPGRPIDFGQCSNGDTRKGTANVGVNRLVRSLRRAGIGPGVARR